MKVRYIVPLAALAICSATTANAQQRSLSDPVVGAANPESLFTSPNAKLNRNKQAALRIQRELLKCHEWARAGEWLTDKYIQHNPVAASGLAGVVHYFVDIAKQQPLSPCPALSANDPNAVVAVVAEGDYVTILTRRELPYADDITKTYTTTWFDTWRFVDGKADEHWDPMALAAPPPRAAVAPAAAMVGTEADRAAIGRLMWNYDRALDNYDAEAYVNSFTPDGAFGRTKGRDALRAMVLGFQKSQDDRRAKGEKLGKMRHFTMNQYLEFSDPTHAKYHYYHQTVFGSGVGGSDTAPVVVSAGNGVDDLVKVGGNWYIQYRNVGPTRAEE